MKKSKLSLGLIACLLSVGSLAGCDPVKSSDKGYLLSYTVDGSTTYKIADDILKEYYDDSDKYQAIFDAIFKVIKRNYFSRDRGSVKYNGVTINLGKPQMTKINAEADKQVAIDKQSAQDKAEANGTRYKKEFEAILKEKGVKTEEELHEKYVGQYQEETFDDNFYTYYVDEMRSGASPITLSNGQTFYWDGYLRDKLPYHVSHLMIELADSSDTNYADGKISKENAHDLYTAVNKLRTTESFKLTAYELSDDEGSRAKYGDLGIMDYDTSFINQFKLGIYAYEQFYLLDKDGYEKTAANGTSIDAKAFEDKYKTQVKDLFNLGAKDTVPTVPFSVFSELESYAETEADGDDEPVIGGADLLFPRNIVYNKYLNRHAAFFIETDYPEDSAKRELDNFAAVSFNGVTRYVLCADDDPTKPIVAVRGSSGGKQEIHFMVVNRSPFGSYTVSDKDYYTTYYYQQDMYPHSGSNKFDTYTNYVSNEKDDSEPRAEEVASKLKSFDSDKLNKYIFLKYLKVEKLVFSNDCKKIEKALMDWIYTTAEKKANENEEGWKKTWNEYIDKLSRQNSERMKLIPQACKILYAHANEGTKEEPVYLEAYYPFASITPDELEVIRHNGRIMDGIDGTPKNGEISDDEIEYYWQHVNVSDAFKVKGGVCNDGEAHI